MKILIVEDDAILGELLREYLQRLDHEKVQVCVNGQQAGMAIEAELFDCAFVDLRLPDVDGLFLLDTLKKQDPGLPVVMMSGYPTMEYTIEAMRKGASDFLTKPFTLQDIALTLERVTKERRLLLENLSLQLECKARKELEQVNQELEEKIQEQVKLFEISREIDEIRSSDELYPRIVELASQLTNVERTSFFIVPPEQDSLMLMAEHGPSHHGLCPSIIDVQEMHFKDLFDHRASHVMLQPEEFKKIGGPFCTRLPEKERLSCWPLRIRGELFGFLMAGHNGGLQHLSATEIKLFDFLVKKAALAIENMALYESLIGNFYAILRSLVNALEAKDLYTGKHSERVTRYTISIATRLGCDGAQIEALRSVGYLHDIGKIGIHDQILNKPSSLTEEEYEIIKEHPSIGDLIVADLGLSQDERSIIRHHHERWDGTGYPDRLAGEDIPLLARIVTIADAFDAMTSKRSYRNTMSTKNAVEELRKHRGKQFDPGLVDAFIDVLESREEFDTLA